jgi:hypothetical protein
MRRKNQSEIKNPFTVFVNLHYIKIFRHKTHIHILCHVIVITYLYKDKKEREREEGVFIIIVIFLNCAI